MLKCSGVAEKGVHQIWLQILVFFRMYLTNLLGKACSKWLEDVDSYNAPLALFAGRRSFSYESPFRWRIIFKTKIGLRLFGLRGHR